MPVQYEGPLEEHATVRQAAGLFDIDHMGQLIVEGPDALDFLQYMCTSDIGALREWEAGYSLLCYADGGVVDDIFVYRLPEYYYVVVNAANLKKDVQWLKAHTPGFDVTVTDVSEETYLLAFQGPKAQEVLQRITDVDLSQLSTISRRAEGGGRRCADRQHRLHRRVWLQHTSTRTTPRPVERHPEAGAGRRKSIGLRA